MLKVKYVSLFLVVNYYSIQLVHLTNGYGHIFTHNSIKKCKPMLNFTLGSGLVDTHIRGRNHE